MRNEECSTIGDMQLPAGIQEGGAAFQFLIEEPNTVYHTWRIQMASFVRILLNEGKANNSHVSHVLFPPLVS